MKTGWRQRMFDSLISGLFAILSPGKFLKRKKKQEEEKRHQDLFKLWQVDKTTFTESYRTLPLEKRGDFWRWLHDTRSKSALSAHIHTQANQLIVELSERVIASRKDRFH